MVKHYAMLQYLYQYRTTDNPITKEDFLTGETPDLLEDALVAKILDLRRQGATMYRDFSVTMLEPQSTHKVTLGLKYLTGEPVKIANLKNPNNPDNQASVEV